MGTYYIAVAGTNPVNSCDNPLRNDQVNNTYDRSKNDREIRRLKGMQEQYMFVWVDKVVGIV